MLARMLAVSAPATVAICNCITTLLELQMNLTVTFVFLSLIVSASFCLQLFRTNCCVLIQLIIFLFGVTEGPDV